MPVSAVFTPVTAGFRRAIPMTSVGSRRLLFAISDLSFCLDLRELVEICEDIEVLTGPHPSDFGHAVPRAMVFRRTQIPLVDLRSRLGLVAAPSTRKALNALVLSSSEGNWALLIDEVEGFQPTVSMQDLDLPPMLIAPGWRCFKQIALYQARPFIKLDLQACYGGISL